LHWTFDRGSAACRSGVEAVAIDDVLDGTLGMLALAVWSRGKPGYPSYRCYTLSRGCSRRWSRLSANRSATRPWGTRLLGCDSRSMNGGVFDYLVAMVTSDPVTRDPKLGSPMKW